MPKKRKEPKIVAFLCNWCAYSGSDLSELGQLKNPPDLRIIRVICSGRIDPVFVLQAFEEGADGVLVAGCRIGDCHYIKGNIQTKERMENLLITLDLIGIRKERLRLEWISAREGQNFKQIIVEFIEKLKELGPIPFPPKLISNPIGGGV